MADPAKLPKVTIDTNNPYDPPTPNIDRTNPYGTEKPVYYIMSVEHHPNAFTPTKTADSTYSGVVLTTSEHKKVSEIDKKLAMIDARAEQLQKSPYSELPLPKGYPPESRQALEQQRTDILFYSKPNREDFHFTSTATYKPNSIVTNPTDIAKFVAPPKVDPYARI